MLAVDLGLQFLSTWGIPCGFSIRTLWGFLTTWWLGSKGGYLREIARQRERERHMNS